MAASSSAARAGRAQQVAWLAAIVVALLYPIPFERSGQIYYETVGFLVLLNAMLGIGWNIIGGWAGQFDFGPSIFFAIGAYTAALLSIHFGWNAWLGLLGAVVVSVAICAAVTYPITRLRGHYPGHLLRSAAADLRARSDQIAPGAGTGRSRCRTRRRMRP